MYLQLVIKYIHFLGIFGVVSCLVLENYLIGKELTRKALKRMVKIDGIYGLASIIVVAAGLSLWFWVGKPASYYSENILFWHKVGLFILVGLMSIYPSIFFIRKRAKNIDQFDEKVTIPSGIIWIIRLELGIVLLLPLLAVLMAVGIGN